MEGEGLGVGCAYSTMPHILWLYPLLPATLVRVDYVSSEVRDDEGFRGEAARLAVVSVGLQPPSYRVAACIT